MRVNSASSQVGLSQVGPGQLGPVISYIAYSFQGIPVLGVFYIYKCSAKVLGNNVWFYLYCWSANLVSLEGSGFITVETTKNMQPLIDKIQNRI